MTTEQLVAVLGGLTALIAAVSALLVQVRSLRGAVDGVLHELVEAKAAAAEKEGELRGRDYTAST